MKRKIQESESILENCSLCPRRCGVNRIKGETGYCRAGYKPKIASFNIHHGEEPPISGTSGSGTIFFSGCVLKCVFCQNFPISQFDNGRVYDFSEIADMMIYLQKEGCHNINLVTPTHYMAQFLKALDIAIDRGLKIPIVYNTGGYELVENIRLLENIADIYLPDAKYADNKNALKHSNSADYVEYNRRALKEMFSQVGLLNCGVEAEALYSESAAVRKKRVLENSCFEHDDRGYGMDDAGCEPSGIARRGLLIRHLVLPENISGSFDFIDFVKRELSADVHIALMSQYFPAHRAHDPDIPGSNEISRRITIEEYGAVADYAEKLGFNNLFLQEIDEF